MNSRLLLRVFSTYIIIITLSVFVLSLLVQNHIKKSSLENIEDELMNYIKIISLFSKSDIEDNIHHLADSVNARLTLIDGNGRVLADSERDISQTDNHLNRTEIQEARLRGMGKAIRFSQTLRADMLYTAVTLHDKSIISGYIRLARPLFAVRNSIQKLYESLFMAILIVIPLSLIIALIFAYRLTAPIKAMEQYTERIRKGEASGILLVNTSDELKKLAGNINYLVDELKSRINRADEEKGKLAAAFASLNEGIMVVNAQLRIELYNRALHQMIDPQYGSVEGKTLMEAFRNIELENAFRLFRNTGQAVSQEITLGDIKPVILDVQISPVEGLPDDKKTMIVFRDVTRLKALENIRADFVANVTHEIRTPLTAILGYVETLQGGNLNNEAEARKFLGIISRQAMRLHRLVEDLLTISNIELGEMQFKFEQVNLHEIVKTVIPVIEPRAKEKQISIQDILPDTLPPIMGDRDRLTQVLMNILDNAVKFTAENGSVTIATLESKEKELVIRISDTGIGVPKDKIARLGERFYRVDKNRSREMGGTGLGLSIVKHLMQAHGGRMEIESQLDKGTTVSLYFPS